MSAAQSFVVASDFTGAQVQEIFSTNQVLLFATDFCDEHGQKSKLLILRCGLATVRNLLEFFPDVKVYRELPPETLIRISPGARALVEAAANGRSLTPLFTALSLEEINLARKAIK